MAVRSDMKNLNASNNYEGRGVLITRSGPTRSKHFALFSLEEKPEMHVVDAKRGIKVKAFGGDFEITINSSHAALLAKDGISATPKQVALAVRDRFLLAAANSGTVCIVNGDFLRMYEVMLALGGVYQGRSKRGVEKVSFKRDSKFSEKFKTLYPEIRVVFDDKVVEVEVHEPVAKRKTKTTANRHPSRVVQRAVAKRRGGAK